MSYSCEINLKRIEPQEIYKFFKELKNQAIYFFPAIARENCFFSPYSNTVSFEKLKGLNREEEYELDTKAYNWAVTVFSYRWFYLESENLLGVFGVPDSLKFMFDAYYYFQNSTDQDYDFNEWVGIPIFEKIAEKWKKSSSEEVLKLFDLKLEDLKGTADLDYYKRSACYKEIWETYFEDKLYSNEETYISLFRQGIDDHGTIRKFCIMCKKEYIEEIESWGIKENGIK